MTPCLNREHPRLNFDPVNHNKCLIGFLNRSRRFLFISHGYQNLTDPSTLIQFCPGIWHFCLNLLVTSLSLKIRFSSMLNVLCGIEVAHVLPVRRSHQEIQKI